MEARSPAGAAAPARYYRPELDILRFFAFMLVFVSHTTPTDSEYWANLPIFGPLATLFNAAALGGAFGVDLFFALSSFLITTLLLKEREAEGRIDVGAFYLRRLLRIWPLYFAFLLLIRPLIPLVLPEEDMPLKYTAAFLLFVGNWACVIWGYPHSVAAPLWSVSMEEQFYLAWPWIVRRWGARLLTVSLVLIGVAFAMRFVLVAGHAEHPQIWDNTLARLDPIACGMILAVVVKRREIVPPLWLRGLLTLFAIAVLLLIGRFGGFTGVQSLVSLPAATVACIALIVAALGLPMPRANPVLRALIYLGRISYGLYVFHQLFVYLLQVPQTLEPGERLARAVLALAGTILAAALSYHALERPFLRLKDRYAHIKSTPVS